jgi:hypothetical protein
MESLEPWMNIFHPCDLACKRAKLEQVVVARARDRY